MLYLNRYKNVFINRALRLLKKEKAERQYKYGEYGISKYLETAKELNIEIIPLGYKMFELRKGDVTKRIMSDLTLDSENPVTCRLCCNKYLTYKVLENNGIKNFPKHKLYTFEEIENAIRDFREWNCRVVIKPVNGTHGGTGVTVNIKNIKELKNAIAHSFVFDRKHFLMEQYIEGSHFRVMTLNGKYIYCSQRIPARIFGNGKDSIKKLIEKENAIRKNDKSEKSLYPILIDNDAIRKLKILNITLNTILEKNRELYIKDVSNFHSGGELWYIENVSEDIKRLCTRIAKILKIYLAGFDIITSDIGKSLEETNGVINEVNTSPGIDNMFLPNSNTHIAEVILKDMLNM